MPCAMTEKGSKTFASSHVRLYIKVILYAKNKIHVHAEENVIIKREQTSTKSGMFAL